ncbi:MAG: hypothetical protein JW913_09175 [Chitinispirillaceae bacterium]|nr:hypothetical protein [Chitinispirillaceae bacterium]
MTGAKRIEAPVKMADRRLRWRCVNGKELEVTGFSQRGVVLLTTLSGRRIASIKTADGQASIDVTSLQGGNYLLTVIDDRGIRQGARVVSVY